LSNIVHKMQEKFDEYWESWEKTNMLIYIVLDPQYKEQYVQIVLELRYGAKWKVGEDEDCKRGHIICSMTTS